MSDVFQAKPTWVRAFQWRGQPPVTTGEDYPFPAWFLEDCRGGLVTPVLGHYTLMLTTPAGRLHVAVGEWVVRDQQHRYVVFGNDQFREQFEASEVDPHLAPGVG